MVLSSSTFFFSGESIVFVSFVSTVSLDWIHNSVLSECKSFIISVTSLNFSSDNFDDTFHVVFSISSVFRDSVTSGVSIISVSASLSVFSEIFISTSLSVFKCSIISVTSVNFSLAKFGETSHVTFSVSSLSFTSFLSGVSMASFGSSSSISRDFPGVSISSFLGFSIDVTSLFSRA